MNSREVLKNHYNTIEKIIFRHTRELEILFYVIIGTLMLDFIFNVFYFSKFNASANFDLSNRNTWLLLILIGFIAGVVFLSTSSQVSFIINNHNKIVLYLFFIFRIMFAMVLILSYFYEKISGIISMVYICSFLYLFYKGLNEKGFYSIIYYSWILQDAFFVFIPLLLYNNNLILTYRGFGIVCSMLFLFLFPFVILLLKGKLKHINEITNTLSFIIFIIFLNLTAPNLVSASGLANKDLSRKIDINDLEKELIDNLDKNFTKFSCKNLKGYSCFEKKGDNSYEIKNLRFLATNIQEIDLYCIILPKDDNSTLNNLPKENCLKIFPKDENIYIDLNGSKDI